MRLAEQIEGSFNNSGLGFKVMTVNGHGNVSAMQLSVAGVILTGIVSIAVLIYGFQNNKLWEHEEAIAELKANQMQFADRMSREVASLEAREDKLEVSIGAVSTGLSSISATLQSLKDANDAQTAATGQVRDQMGDLRRQLGEIDSVLRPLRTMPASPPSH